MASPAHHLQPTPTQGLSGTDSRSKKAQVRQLLSCTKCRERKVKCDRTKPCSSCCRSGHPKDCEFLISDGNDYGPIQQSYEIRKLRDENIRLRERLQMAGIHLSDDEEEDLFSQDGTKVRSPLHGSNVRQRRFKTADRIDNLYFGTPGLANVIQDFASMQIGGNSITHAMPKGRDMYAAEPRGYPFQIVAGVTTSLELLQLLPLKENLFAILDIFQQRAQACAFPHTPDEMTKREVELFLADVEHNAERHPDMLALIFITLASGLQIVHFDRNGGQWTPAAAHETRVRSDAFVPAKHASFLNQPTLLGIQTLIMMGPYLTNSGRFLDAWTLFGTTIRLAHSIGLHRNPRFLDPVPPLRECTIRQTLWWWMLHMDQQYSVTLGRPLGISGIGDCPPPEQVTTNVTMLRLSQFIDRFTVLARQILGSDGMMNGSKIDEFTDKLLGLWDTMPAALQFNERWLHSDDPLPEWPLEAMGVAIFAKVQSFLVLLNRQYDAGTRSQTPVSREASPPALATPPAAIPSSGLPSEASAFASYFQRLHQQPCHTSPLRGRSMVISSSLRILHAFMFFWHRNSAVLVCWTIGQQAFNACMILLLDAWETGNDANEWIVNQAFAVFNVLHKQSVHTMATLAVQRISEWLARLEDRRRRWRTLSLSDESQAGAGHALTLDTSSLTGGSTDAVMGNTGMFLLEDSGLQALNTPAFLSFGWTWSDGEARTRSSTAELSHLPSPVNSMTAATFPAMTTPFASPVSSSPFTAHFAATMNSPQSVPASRRPNPSQPMPFGYYGNPNSFTHVDPHSENRRRSSYPQLPGSRLTHPPASQNGVNKRQKTMRHS